MGEISRTIGILGENIAIENFLKIIGWRGTPNIEIKCKQKDRHLKRTHGLDFFAAYKCPLVTDTQENIIVSIKYNELPTAIKETFNKYVKDVVYASECFKLDPLYRTLTEHITSSKRKHSNVIFWLNHSEEVDKSLLKSIGNISSELNMVHEGVYLVDNSQITFIYKSIRFAQALYPNAVVEFEYPDTGINQSFDGVREFSGKVLPVQFITSKLLPIRIGINSQKILLLTVKEKFDEDSLKRLTGLAQSLTSGWCNKIILAFPDYQAKEHALIKDSVMMRFTQNQFADMIEVRSYMDSFKSLERDESVDFAIVPEMQDELNIETMLPYGDQLRQLLSQSYIYKPDLQILLSRRGVYVNNKMNKELLIPFLTTTLISPAEFEFLRRKQNTKESADRIITRDIITDSKVFLNQLLPSHNVPINEIVQNSNTNCKLLAYSPFVREENGDYRLKFNVQRHNLSKDWARSKSIHTAEIVVKPADKNGMFNKNRIDIVSNSQETKIICRDIIDNILSTLQQEGHIQANTKVQKMLANEFTNVQRTNFLFSLVEITKDDSKSIIFYSITHIDFNPDKNKKLPEDIDSLKDKVEHSIFTGRNLEEIKYIKDKTYRELFIFSTITAEYNFTYKDLKGRFRVEFGFPDLNNSTDDKSEFEFKILEVIPFNEISLTKMEYYDIEMFVRTEFNRIKMVKYDTGDRKYGKQLDIF